MKTIWKQRRGTRIFLYYLARLGLLDRLQNPLHSLPPGIQLSLPKPHSEGKFKQFQDLFIDVVFEVYIHVCLREPFPNKQQKAEHEVVAPQGLAAMSSRRLLQNPCSIQEKPFLKVFPE